jgi:hypothetical protein
MMKIPRFTEFHLSHEGEWLYGGSDVVPQPAAPRTVAVLRLFFDGTPTETRATTPSAQPYLERLLERHPFDEGQVRTFVVLGHGTPTVVLQARSKFEAVRYAGMPPEGLEVRAQDELPPEEWRELVRTRA